jgi:hypothetical protein
LGCIFDICIFVCAFVYLFIYLFIYSIRIKRVYIRRSQWHMCKLVKTCKY